MGICKKKMEIYLKKEKKMEVSIIKEGSKKMEVYIKKMVFLFEKKKMDER